MKSLSAGLLAHYASAGTSVATCWKITRRDGEVFGFTDHDQPIEFAGVVYEARTGFTGSSVDTSAQLKVSNLQVSGFLDSESFTVADAESGRWDGARFEIFEVNWADLSQGRNVLLTGWLGPVTRQGQLFVTQLHSLTSALQKPIGQVIGPMCAVKFGSPRCGFDLSSVTIDDEPVTSVTSNRQFAASGLADPAGYFNFGTVTFTTGNNAGIVRDIKEHQAAGVIILQQSFPFTIQVADEFTITPGCNKLHQTAPGVYDGDCGAKWDNVINFQGDPWVPLLNKTMQTT